MSYIIKKLEIEDAQHLDSLKATYENLSAIGDISINEAKNIIQRMQAQGSITYIALDEQSGIIGACTLLVEQKLQKQGANAGHIEDVVVRKGFEGQGIASELMDACMQEAERHNCYKVILDCDENLTKFYEKFGFKVDGSFMRKYLK